MNIDKTGLVWFYRFTRNQLAKIQKFVIFFKKESLKMIFGENASQNMKYCVIQNSPKKNRIEKLRKRIMYLMDS
jgi:hypothetical protein